MDNDDKYKKVSVIFFEGSVFITGIFVLFAIFKPEDIPYYGIFIMWGFMMAISLVFSFVISGYRKFFQN